MSLVQEWRARERGNEICRTLLLRGHEPLWFKTEAEGDRIIVCFQIIPDRTPESGWRKAIVLDEDDDPNTAEKALIDWKAEHLKRLNDGEPAEIVQQAIGRYGEMLVRAALAARTVH